MKLSKQRHCGVVLLACIWGTCGSAPGLQIARAACEQHARRCALYLPPSGGRVLTPHAYFLAHPCTAGDGGREGGLPLHHQHLPQLSDDGLSYSGSQLAVVWVRRRLWKVLAFVWDATRAAGRFARCSVNPPYHSDPCASLVGRCLVHSCASRMSAAEAIGDCLAGWEPWSAGLSCIGPKESC